MGCNAYCLAGSTRRMFKSRSLHRRLRLRLRRTALTGVVTCGLWATPALGQPGESEATTQKATATVQPITIDGRNGGRRFDGIGGVSAGASTRLLFDYPEPARSDILDYLFKPNYGMVTQILKVEIGGDTNSTSGAEPSHMRSPDDLNFERGYEWWLMKEAKKRNPDIVLAALQWGAPSWLEGGFWSQDNIDYIIKWLDGAEEHGLEIDYVGGWNEVEHEADWFPLLDKALEEQHPDVQIIAADGLPHRNWRIATDMANDPEVHAAVDVIGEHSPGVWRSLYQNYKSSDDARRSGKPLWASEQSSLSHDVGGASWARGLNRAYIDAQITASLNWAPISAWYANFPIADTGLIVAEWPWSGHYMLGSNVWVHAHTTQFAQPGWQYVDSACGYLDTGASYVTLKSPDGEHYSIVIETMDAEAPSKVQFTVTGGLSTDPVHVWSTDVNADDAEKWFVEQDPIQPKDGVFTVALDPGHVYSVTTTTGQKKGDAQSPSSVGEQMPLPFEEDFERYEPGRLARYFSDLNGGFETAKAAGGREGMAYQQMVPQKPITWGRAGHMGPTTVVGDPRWWGDYEVAADVFLEEDGAVELIGRLSAQRREEVAGYHLRVGTDGRWTLYSQELKDVREGDVEIASGEAPLEKGQWHRVALRMQGNNIEILVDGESVGKVTDDTHTTGNVGLRVEGWQPVQFDNVTVTPTGPAPQFIPQDQFTVTATSEHDRFVRGDVYKTAYLTDGRPESFWHSAFDPRAPLPQAVTLDMGSARTVAGLAYQPRIDEEKGGMITRYQILVSDDGEEFEQVAEGQWAVSTATKTATWSPREGRFVRLVALEGVNDVASAAEINISTTPIPPRDTAAEDER